MKVFDFSNGIKGKLLAADVKRPGWLAGWFTVKNSTVYKITLPKAPGGGEWTWHSAVGYGWRDTPTYKELKPEDFGVEAICFCTGAWRCDGQDVWQWAVVGTQDWNRKACQAGILKATFDHMVEEDAFHEEDAA